MTSFAFENDMLRMDGPELMKSTTILVIGNERYCEELEGAINNLLKQPEYANKHYVLLSCENVSDILRVTNELNAHYVVFVLNPLQENITREVERNLQVMDISFVCGRTCIINGSNKMPLSKVSASLNEISALRKKYDIPVLNGDIMVPDDCLNLAQRLLKLMDVMLGINLSKPFIPWLLDF